MRKDKRNGAGLYAASASLLLSGMLLSGNAWAQAVLNPNQIVGTIQFTNENPEILSILNSEGFSYGFLRADSIGITPALNNYSFPTATASTTLDYELTVEAAPEGIPYKVTAEMRLDQYGEKYLFGSQESTGLLPEPNADARVDFKQCAGMLDIKVVDANGDPVNVSGGNVIASRETAAGSGVFQLQAQDFAWTRNSSREYLAVHGDNSLYRVDAYLQSGSDPFSDQVSTLCRKDVQVACDQIVEVICPVGGTMALGDIKGTLDVLGEEENDVGYLARATANNGPLKNYRYDKIPGSGPFNLLSLVPSDADSPSRDYTVFGEMSLRSGYRTQYLRTPMLGGYYNDGVRVEAGKTTDLGNTFVLDPGYVTGSIRLSAPPAGTDGSFLEDLYRDADRDYDNNGLPDEVRLIGSHVGAYGSPTIAAGAQVSAWGGIARAGFAGNFNAETSVWQGDYELVLGGLNQQNSVWRPSNLVLKFDDRKTPQVPESFQYSWLSLTNHKVSNHEIVAGETQQVDHDYCMNEVMLSYKSLAGTFFNPRARAYGRFDGIDYQGNQALYSASLAYANGTPSSIDTAAATGLVMMTLPQGSFDITPTVTAINPNGGTSNTELRPVAIEVGCRQSVRLTTDLAVSADEIPQTTESDVLIVSGSVSGVGSVQRIDFTHNGGPADNVCTDCGSNPNYDFEVTLEPGDNEIVVTALGEYGDEASVTSRVSYEPPAQPEPEPVDPLVLQGCNDISKELDAYASGGKVKFGISASGGCDAEPTLSCTPESGSWFGLGDTQVQCSVIDSCGSTAQCSFNVSLSAAEPEPQLCDSAANKPQVTQNLRRSLLWPPNHNLVNVGFNASATDECDSLGKGDMVTEVWSDETEVPRKGDGSGRFAPDAKEKQGQLRLRAERRGTEDGRVYLIISKATDAADQTGHSCRTVVVPHSRSKASIRSVRAQAKQAQAFCEANGGKAPKGYTRHGVSRQIGKKQ